MTTPEQAAGRAAPRKQPTHDERCGTNAGYEAHRRRGEDPCDQCRDAHNTYMSGYHREYRAQAPTYAGTRRRALERLAELHPADFRRLLAEEVAQ